MRPYVPRPAAPVEWVFEMEDREEAQSLWYVWWDNFYQQIFIIKSIKSILGQERLQFIKKSDRFLPHHPLDNQIAGCPHLGSAEIEVI